MKRGTLGNHGGELSLEKVYDNKEKGECDGYGWFVRQLLILRVRREESDSLAGRVAA